MGHTVQNAFFMKPKHDIPYLFIWRQFCYLSDKKNRQNVLYWFPKSSSAIKPKVHFWMVCMIIADHCTGFISVCYIYVNNHLIKNIKPYTPRAVSLASVCDVLIALCNYSIWNYYTKKMKYFMFRVCTF